MCLAAGYSGRSVSSLIGRFNGRLRPTLRHGEMVSQGPPAALSKGHFARVVDLRKRADWAALGCRSRYSITIWTAPKYLVPLLRPVEVRTATDLDGGGARVVAAKGRAAAEEGSS